MASEFKRCLLQYGPESVAFYVSGQLLTEDYYVANKLMKGYIGSANIDTNSRLCMSSAVAGYKRAFGEDVVPVSYEDLDVADLVVLVGSNTAWCHPVLLQRLTTARACSLELAQLQQFYELFAATPAVITMYSQGVNQSSAGTDKCNAIINCHLASGRLGKPGAGPFSVTGQPNAMGGREVGGFANTLAAHVDIEDAAG